MPTETTPGSVPMMANNDNNNPAAAAVFDNVFQHDITSAASQDNVGASTLGVPPSTEAASLDQKPTAVKPPPPSPSTTIKRVVKSSFNFKSNIVSSSTDTNTHPCGILHASKTINNTEQHTFGWITNIHNLQTTHNVIDYLNKYGYKSSSFKFIPYSNKQSWINKYPQCNVTFDVDTNGNVVGNTDWEVEQLNDLNEKKNMLSSSKKKKSPRKSQPKLLPSSILPNKQRSELHLEIYNYFNWLHNELQDMEKTNHSGRRQVTNAGINVLSLKGMIGKMENTFKVLQDVKDTGVDNNVTADTMARNNNNGDSGMNVDDIQLPIQKKTLPYLETALEYELNARAALLSSSSTPTTSSTTTTTKKQSTESKISWRTLNFDILYQKLVDFKNDKGHVSPPFKHPELGRWVSELRSNKKVLRERGLEFEQPLVQPLGGEDKTTTAVATAAVGKTEETSTGETEQQPPKKKQKREIKKQTPPTSNTYLSQNRVQQLDSIKFIWSIITNRATWDERFEELKLFKVVNGRWPTTKEGTIGNWLKNQRKLFSKEDVDFMTNKRSKVSLLTCV